MATLDTTTTFTIDCIGETTGESYKGVFKVRRFLSHQNHIDKDRAKRELLGGTHPENASPRADSTAEVIAQCMVSIVDEKVPSFWRDSRGGLDLIDEKPVIEIYNKVIEIQEKAVKELKAKSEDAKEELKTLKPDENELQ